MRFWQDGVVTTLILLGAMLVMASAVRRLWPRLPVPDCILAGVAAFALGAGDRPLVPLDQGTMESVVYHGLALSFICLGLRRGRTGVSWSPGARSVMFVSLLVACVQGVIGLALILAMTVDGEAVHPGVGLMLPLGFSQGPGVALSMGQAWETTAGLSGGGQLGLLFATLGFAWALGGGLVMVLARWGRPRRSAPAGPARAEPARWVPVGGGIEPLGAQVGLACLVYTATWCTLLALDGLFAAGSTGRATLWGFHFTVAALWAVSARRLVRGRRLELAFDDDLLGRLGLLAIDVTTMASIAALRPGQIARWWVPVLVITTVGGLVTWFVIRWVGRRAFPAHPGEHTITLYGMATGTLPTGMALLRMVDPQLETPTAEHVVVGASSAVLLALPLLAVLAVPVTGWPESHPGNTLLTVGIIVAYAVVLGALWRWGPGRARRR